MIDKFLRILFPEICPVCKKPSRNHRIAPVCPACWKEITPYNGPICQICGKPLVSQASITCADCIVDKPIFKMARSFGIYEGALRVAINLFKYYGIKRLSKPLSEMIFTLLGNKYLSGFKINSTQGESQCRGETLPVDVIIPVPLYKKRLRQRGFNQSALFAKHLANHIGVPLLLNCLIKIRDTKPQVGLSAKERRENIRNSFAVISRKFIQGKDILLVDDVFTTGATVRECSKLLKKAGVEDIYVLTLAHGRMD
jgi:ComF family protein